MLAKKRSADFAFPWLLSTSAIASAAVRPPSFLQGFFVAPVQVAH
jgi:hypothetical protein